MAIRRGLTQLCRTRSRNSSACSLPGTRCSGGTGPVVSVVGEAGLGKSRLLYEFKRQSGADRDTRYVEGTCFTYGGSISYLPFLDVVRACMRAGGTDRRSRGQASAGQPARPCCTWGSSQRRWLPTCTTCLSFTVEDDLFTEAHPGFSSAAHRRRPSLTLVVAEATHRSPGADP